MANRPVSTPSPPGDRIFHGTFAQMPGNPGLVDFAHSLYERSACYWHLHLSQTMDAKATIRRHTAIADMIATGDGAANAARDHIEKLASAAAEGAESNAAP
jgi:DNA-binding GntR family transcriptional regulator